MSMFMNLEGLQVLNGRLLPLFQNGNVWDGSNEATGCLVDDHVSPPANNWLGYGMEDSMVIGGGFGLGKSTVDNCVSADQQVHTLLSSSEESYFSDGQIRQVSQLLQTNGCSAVLPAGYQYLNVANCGLPLPREHSFNIFETPLSSPWHTAVANTGNSLSSSDYREVGRLSGDDVMDMLTQLCDTIDGDMIIDQAEIASFDSFLPPVSPEDVDSLLSIDSPSQDAVGFEVSSSSTLVANAVMIDSDEALSDGGWSSMDSAAVVPQVVRKKEQNKTAALRYRQKKRNEHGSVLSVCDELESRNVELKTKVSDMEREINYLKGLIAEIYA